MHIGPILRAMKHSRTRVVLIILEIAMTLAIVTNCVNVILAEQAKMAEPSGFDDDNMVWMRSRPFSAEFQQEGFIDLIIDADVRTIASIPGVRAVANTHFRPWEGGGSSAGVKPVGVVQEPTGTQFYFTTWNIIETLGARLVEGRPFRESDHGVGTQPDTANTVIISSDLARDLFPEGNAVGKAIIEANSATEPDPDGEPLTVVGVIDRFYNPWGIAGGDHQALGTRVMFLPARVGSYGGGMSYLIRTEPGATTGVIAEVEKRLSAANSGRVFEFMKMDEKRGRWFSSSKIVVTTMTCIIIALVSVTALGILGLTSLSVTERTRQIGTRRALGATRSDVLRHFLIENWLVTTAGLALGIAGAYALNFLLVSQVSDVKLQWQLVAAGVGLLWVIGLLATVPPAMRAAMVSPSIATRSV